MLIQPMKNRQYEYSKSFSYTRLTEGRVCNITLHLTEISMYLSFDGVSFSDKLIFIFAGISVDVKKNVMSL